MIMHGAPGVMHSPLAGRELGPHPIAPTCTLGCVALLTLGDEVGDAGDDLAVDDVACLPWSAMLGLRPVARRAAGRMVGVGSSHDERGELAIQAGMVRCGHLGALATSPHVAPATRGHKIGGLVVVANVIEVVNLKPCAPVDWAGAPCAQVWSFADLVEQN